MSEYDYLITSPCHDRLVNGNKYYDIEYYCSTDEELALVDQSKGELAGWATTTAYISDRELTRFSAAGPPYILKLSASPRGGGGSTEGYLDSSNYDNFCARRYGKSEIIIKPEWFGAKKATKEDAGYDKDQKKVIESNARLNLKGNHCKEGDYIYDNSTAENKGSYDMFKSPFSEKTELSDSFVLNALNQKLKTQTFQVEYYSNDDINKFHGFSGINGSNGFPTPRVKPKITDAGKWRVIDQSTGEVLDNDGNVRTHIVRQFEFVPFSDFTWNADKNGGTWSW